MAKVKKKKYWLKLLKEQTESIGTYREEFDSVIDSLAELIVRRDLTYQEFVENGGQAVIEQKGVLVTNPRLKEFENLDTLCLKYWRELGLTPAGLKKLNDDAMKPKKKSALAGLL